MYQRRIPSFTPGHYDGMMDLPVSHDAYQFSHHGSVTPELRQGSFGENPAFHDLVHNYSGAQMTKSAEGIFDPWLLEQANCGSSLSTSSSISRSERVLTPVDPGHAVYNLLDQPDAIPDNNLSGCWVEPHQTNWQQHYPEGDVWSAQTPIHSWCGGGGYISLPPPTMEPTYQPVNQETTPSFSLPLQSNLTGAPAVDSAPFRLAEASTTIGRDDSSADTDSASDDSDYEESNTNYSQAKSTSSKRRSNQKYSPVLNLGKWSMVVDPFAPPEQRNYVCNLEVNNRSGAAHFCQQRFVRPEHLRRHMKTVHGNHRDYPCKVPRCPKVFSRGDNLRDHYWTHLSRGGRAGKNEKMSLEDLKAILGPKERKLLKILKRKLQKHKAKQH